VRTRTAVLGLILAFSVAVACRPTEALGFREHVLNRIG
jgi:hypothetical protein